MLNYRHWTLIQNRIAILYVNIVYTPFQAQIPLISLNQEPLSLTKTIVR